jgi:hypothetical protein
MARPFAHRSAAIVLASLAFAGCAPVVASGPKAPDATEESASPVGRSDGAPGTVKQVDHFLTETPLLSKVGPDLAGQYRKAKEKKKEVTGLRALVASEQTELDRAKSGDEKTEHAQRLADLKKMAEAGERSESRLEEQLVATAKGRSRRAAPRVRATLAPVVANLRQAVADAHTPDQDGELSLQAVVLDAVLDGFTKAGWKRDGGAAGPATRAPEASHAPRSTPHAHENSAHENSGAVASVAPGEGYRSAKGASSAPGTREVFAP